MSAISSQKSLIIMISVLTFVICLTYLISILARGYQPEFNQNGFKLKATGIISATSVYVDNLLVTATDDTINLSPGEYQIKIEKENYLTWIKKYVVEKEKVYQTETELFLQNPKTIPFINEGIENIEVSIDKSKVAFYLATASADKKSGIYILDTSYAPFQINKLSPKLIFSNTPLHQWSKYSLKFSPDSKQLLASSRDKKSNYLFNLEQIGNSNNLIDVSSKLKQIQTDWELQSNGIITDEIGKLPLSIKAKISTSSAQILYSNDETKILYQSLDNYYIYDQKKENTYLVGPINSIINPFWIYQTNNLIFQNPKNEIIVIDYDGENPHSILNFPNINIVFFPSPDSSKIFIFQSNIKSSFLSQYQIR
jgi:hypothetical protein